MELLHHITASLKNTCSKFEKNLDHTLYQYFKFLFLLKKVWLLALQLLLTIFMCSKIVGNYTNSETGELNDVDAANLFFCSVETILSIAFLTISYIDFWFYSTILMALSSIHQYYVCTTYAPPAFARFGFEFPFSALLLLACGCFMNYFKKKAEESVSNNLTSDSDESLLVSKDEYVV